MKVAGEKKGNMLFWSLLNMHGILSVLSFSKLPSKENELTEPFELMMAAKIVERARRVRAFCYYVLISLAASFYLASIVIYGKCFLLEDPNFKCYDGSTNLCYFAFLAALTPALSAIFLIYDHCMIFKRLRPANRTTERIHNGVMAINLVFMITFALIFLFAVPKGVIYEGNKVLVKPFNTHTVASTFCLPLIFYFIAFHLGIFTLSTIVAIVLRQYRGITGEEVFH